MTQTPQTLLKSLLKGLSCKCPQCGRGKIYHGFTKVSDTCPSCTEEFFHHRADDFPPYIVVTIVGHIIVPLMLYFSVNYDMADWVQMAIWVPLSLILTFALMQPVKGAVIAYQWHVGMFGFEHSKGSNASPDELPDMPEAVPVTNQAAL